MQFEAYSIAYGVFTIYWYNLVFHSVDIIDAVKYMSAKKAIRMRGFLSSHKDQLDTIQNGEIIRPLLLCMAIAQGAF